jgi:hypothetical protein
MQKTLKLALVFPLLFAVCQFVWEKIPMSVFPQQIRTVLTDSTGPSFLMMVIIFSACTLFWHMPLIKVITRFLFDTNICIQGTWKGTLYYEYMDEQKSKPVYLCIKQRDAFSVTTWLLTDERTSISRQASISPYNESFQLLYEYGVEDSSENRIENPLHTGFCVFDICLSGKQMILTGNYYTSRKTAGKIEFTQRNKNAVTNYQFAERLFF